MKLMQERQMLERKKKLILFQQFWDGSYKYQYQQTTAIIKEIYRLISFL